MLCSKNELNKITLFVVAKNQITSLCVRGTFSHCIKRDKLIFISFRLICLGTTELKSIFHIAYSSSGSCGFHRVHPARADKEKKALLLCVVCAVSPPTPFSSGRK